jgi:hypothetical protein
MHRDRIEARFERIGNSATQRTHSPDARSWRNYFTLVHDKAVLQADSRPQAELLPPGCMRHPHDTHDFTCKPLI